MSVKTYHKGELTRVISLTPLGLGVDITAYTVTIYINKPDGVTQLTKTGTIDDGPTNQVHWSTASGDLNQLGEYIMQAKCVSGGTTLYGNTETFYVEDVLA